MPMIAQAITRQVFLERQRLVDDRLDDHGQAGRAGGVQQHGDSATAEAAAVRRRVDEQTLERMLFTR